MVAGARLLEPLQVLLELLLRAERRPIHAREHLAVGVAAPVGARHARELERLDPLGAGAVRAAAQVGEGAVAVERDGLHALVSHQVLDQLDLVVLPLAAEALDRVGHRDVLALEVLVGLDVLAHLGLDALEVVLGDLHAVRELEVVVEAVLDRGADRDLHARVELHHRGGEHVRGVVADQPEAVLVAAGDDLDLGAVASGASRSRSSPSTRMPSAARASPSPMARAASAPVAPSSSWSSVPSGSWAFIGLGR